MNYEQWADILSFIAIGSAPAAFVCYVVGTVLFYGRIRSLIHAVGGRTSTLGFTLFPIMLFECIRARRMFNKSGQETPKIISVEIFILAAIIVFFGLFLLAGFGSVFLMTLS